MRLNKLLLFLLITLVASLIGAIVIEYMNEIFGTYQVFITCSVFVYVVGFLLSIKKIILAYKKDVHWMKVEAYGFLALIVFLGLSIVYCFKYI